MKTKTIVVDILAYGTLAALIYPLDTWRYIAAFVLVLCFVLWNFKRGLEGGQ